MELSSNNRRTLESSRLFREQQQQLNSVSIGNDVSRFSHSNSNNVMRDQQQRLLLQPLENPRRYHLMFSTMIGTRYVFVAILMFALITTVYYSFNTGNTSNNRMMQPRYTVNRENPRYTNVHASQHNDRIVAMLSDSHNSKQQHKQLPALANGNSNDNSEHRFCLNTQQGRVRVTDDTGATCYRQHLLGNGCCDTAAAAATVMDTEGGSAAAAAVVHYSCDSCDPQLLCCEAFEFCVSCCLRFTDSSNNRVHAAAMTDDRANSHSNSSSGSSSDSSSNLFPLCLHVCRTNSKSLLHGNSYKHKYKHCFGEAIAAVEQQQQQQSMIQRRQAASASDSIGNKRNNNVAISFSDRRGHSKAISDYSNSNKHQHSSRNTGSRSKQQQQQLQSSLRFDEAVIVVALAGVSCRAACAHSSMRQQVADADAVPTAAAAAEDTRVLPIALVCWEVFLPLLNHCDVMQQHLHCDAGCIRGRTSNWQHGGSGDQPSMIVATTATTATTTAAVATAASTESNAATAEDADTLDAAAAATHVVGMCLTNSDSSSFHCDAQHQHSQRLCPCVDADVAALYI